MSVHYRPCPTFPGQFIASSRPMDGTNPPKLPERKLAHTLRYSVPDGTVTNIDPTSLEFLDDLIAPCFFFNRTSKENFRVDSETSWSRRDPIIKFSELVSQGRRNQIIQPPPKTTEISEIVGRYVPISSEIAIEMRPWTSFRLGPVGSTKLAWDPVMTTNYIAHHRRLALAWAGNESMSWIERAQANDTMWDEAVSHMEWWVVAKGPFTPPQVSFLAIENRALPRGSTYLINHYNPTPDIHCYSFYTITPPEIFSGGGHNWGLKNQATGILSNVWLIKENLDLGGFSLGPMFFEGGGLPLLAAQLIAANSCVEYTPTGHVKLHAGSKDKLTEINLSKMHGHGHPVGSNNITPLMNHIALSGMNLIYPAGYGTSTVGYSSITPFTVSSVWNCLRTNSTLGFEAVGTKPQLEARTAGDRVNNGEVNQILTQYFPSDRTWLDRKVTRSVNEICTLPVGYYDVNPVSRLIEKDKAEIQDNYYKRIVMRNAQGSTDDDLLKKLEAWDIGQKSYVGVTSYIYNNPVLYKTFERPSFLERQGVDLS